MKNYRYLVLILIVSAALSSCRSSTTQIAENTFVHKGKIYKLIDNELREIGDLDSKNIKKFEVLKPQQRNLGKSSLAFIKPGAYTGLISLYRGNFLYYKLALFGFDDLKVNYYPGTLTIQFVDQYGFILHSIAVPTSDLVQVVNDAGKIEYFEYNGKTEMSTEINSAISSYGLEGAIHAH